MIKLKIQEQKTFTNLKLLTGNVAIPVQVVHLERELKLVTAAVQNVLLASEMRKNGYFTRG